MPTSPPCVSVCGTLKKAGEQQICLLQACLPPAHGMYQTCIRRKGKPCCLTVLKCTSERDECWHKHDGCHMLWFLGSRPRCLAMPTSVLRNLASKVWVLNLLFAKLRSAFFFGHPVLRQHIERMLQASVCPCACHRLPGLSWHPLPVWASTGAKNSTKRLHGICSCFHLPRPTQKRATRVSPTRKLESDLSRLNLAKHRTALGGILGPGVAHRRCAIHSGRVMLPGLRNGKKNMRTPMCISRYVTRSGYSAAPESLAVGHVGRVVATTFESLDVLRERYKAPARQHADKMGWVSGVTPGDLDLQLHFPF